ncbi:MAG TPA: biotin--[acetyl-CoA-carboxylase] ligase [Gaiellaceae bacterium]|nr:biotin--[acetyl-CoA-carboxylase] ligase [Gaiellaceae bacterium]
MSELSPDAVLPLLRGRLGRPYRFVERTPSTQRLLGDDEPEGTAVAADEQTEGRGRLGRSWHAPAGRAILVSVLLRPQPHMALWPELSLVAGEAVAAALPLDAAVSFPNDVMVDGRKVCGILPEAQPGLVRLGIGLNVNQTAAELPADTPKPATSLRVELGRELERAPLLAAILFELETRYDAWQVQHLP